MPSLSSQLSSNRKVTHRPHNFPSTARAPAIIPAKDAVTVSGKASAVDRLSALSSCLPIILQRPLRQNQLQQHRKRLFQSCSHQAAFQVGSLVNSSTLISRGQLFKIADRIEKVASVNSKNAKNSRCLGSRTRYLPSYPLPRVARFPSLRQKFV